MTIFHKSEKLLTDLFLRKISPDINAGILFWTNKMNKLIVYLYDSDKIMIHTFSFRRKCLIFILIINYTKIFCKNALWHVSLSLKYPEK